MKADGNESASSSEARNDVVASFSVTPRRPSSFDTVRLFDYSYDSSRIGILSRTWDLGDGTTSEEALPSHRYRSDGDYTVTLTVTTSDGRTASARQSVRVATHDVSVTSINAPRVCAAGDTHSIVVRVTSGRRRETTHVELIRVARNGVREQAGVQTATVELGQSLELSFPYTFTAADAAAGPVRFEALATIVGARDAVPSDNIASTPPTVVR
jgi:PKD repeat protein